MAAAVEKHSSKEELPVAPEDLREEVKKPVKLRHTEVVEKIILPTEEDIKFEKHQQCNSPILTDVAAFNRNSLRQTDTEEKTLLPSSEEYSQIKNEKQAFRKEISHFEKGKLKHVTPEEKHDVAAIDESGDK